MTAGLSRRAAAVAATVAILVLGACAAPYDSDGEVMSAGTLAPAPARSVSAVPVVVDTDLGADDLVALALLLRHPGVRVDAITVAATGLVGCPEAVDVVADLAAALSTSVPVLACGRAEPGPSGRAMPAEWRSRAAEGNGLPRASAIMRHLAPVQVSPRPAAEVLAQTARATDDLTVVALGPLTNLADLSTSDPKAFASLRAVTVMGGVLDAAGESGIGEWNAAADPDAFEAVLGAVRSGGPRLTIVPLDVVPDGTPPALRAPVVGSVSAQAGLPAWWDVAAAAVVVQPTAAVVTSGGYALGGSEPGRLRRTGDGPVRMVTSLDEAELEEVYGQVFAVAS